jgi:putative ABC transport system permease protein
MLVASTTRPPTVAEEGRLRAEFAEADRDLNVFVQRRPTGRGVVVVVLALAGAVVTLAAAAVATGLANADTEPDLATLGAVGASPGLRRRLSMSRSGVIAVLGSLLGVLAGVGTAVAVLLALNQRDADSWPAAPPYPIEVPWVNLAVALVAVPAVAMLGTALLTRARLPVERRL